MIDTITLLSTDFYIDESSLEDYFQKIFYKNNCKYVYNTDLFRLTYTVRNINNSFRKKFLYITFELPSLINYFKNVHSEEELFLDCYVHNKLDITNIANTPTRNQFKMILQQIFVDLHLKGIYISKNRYWRYANVVDIDFSCWKVKRLDLYTDIEYESDISIKSIIFYMYYRYTNFKMLKKIAMKKDYAYLNYIGNESRKFCIYSKSDKYFDKLDSAYEKLLEQQINTQISIINDFKNMTNDEKDWNSHLYNLYMKVHNSFEIMDSSGLDNWKRREEAILVKFIIENNLYDLYRVELRLKRNILIKDYGINTLQDLFDKYSQLPYIYEKEANKMLFANDFVTFGRGRIKEKGKIYTTKLIVEAYELFKRNVEISITKSKIICSKLSIVIIKTFSMIYFSKIIKKILISVIKNAIFIIKFIFVMWIYILIKRLII